MILATAVLALALGAAEKPCVAGEAIKQGQRSAVQRASMTHLEGIRLMAGVKAKAEIVCGTWARVRAVPPAGKSADAWLLLHKEPNGWKVLLGPGTEFSAEDRAKAKVPETIWPPKK